MFFIYYWCRFLVSMALSNNAGKHPETFPFQPMSAKFDMHKTLFSYFNLLPSTYETSGDTIRAILKSLRLLTDQKKFRCTCNLTISVADQYLRI